MSENTSTGRIDLPIRKPVIAEVVRTQNTTWLAQHGITMLSTKRYPFLEAIVILHRVVASVLIGVGVAVAINEFFGPLETYATFYLGIEMIVGAVIMFCVAEGIRITIDVAADIHDLRDFLTRK